MRLFIYLITAASVCCSISQALLPSSFVTDGFTLQKQSQRLMLYYSPSCPYCQKVLNYLNKIGKTVPMKNIQNDKSARNELKNLGGKMQVPCLFIDEKPLYESDTIVDWLSKHKEQLT